MNNTQFLALSIFLLKLFLFIEAVELNLSLLLNKLIPLMRSTALEI